MAVTLFPAAARGPASSAPAGHAVGAALLRMLPVGDSRSRASSCRSYAPSPPTRRFALTLSLTLNLTLTLTLALTLALSLSLT